MLDEAGAVASLLMLIVNPPLHPSLCFFVLLSAPLIRPVTFLTEPADRFPDSYVLLFGINQPVEAADIDFDAITLDISRPVTAPFLPTINSISREFGSALGTRSWNQRTLAAELDTTSQLTATNRGQPNSSFTISPLKFETRSLNNEARDRRRSTDVSLHESGLSPSELAHSARTTLDEFDLIDLQFRLFSNGRRRSLRDLTYRQSMPPYYNNPKFESPNHHSGTSDSLFQVDALEQGERRAFLRMNWSDQELIPFDTKELLAARMIDIDKVFANAWLLGPSELNRNESFAERPDNHVSELRQTLPLNCKGLDRSFEPLGVSSLALEVGGESIDRPVDEPLNFSDSHALPEKADAGPPKPNTNRAEVTKGQT